MAGLLGAASGACRPAPPAPAEDRARVAPASLPEPTEALLEPDTPRYELRFERRAQRRIDVRSIHPARGRVALELAMPTWIPGSYLVREFSRNVVAPAARSLDGRPLPLTKTAKNRLRIEVPPGAEAVVLEYELFTAELSVRESFVGPEFAIVNPAATFFAEVDGAPARAEIALHLPAGWSDAHAALARATSTSTSVVRFIADDFDALVDAPIVAGDVRVEGFSVREVPHHLVHVGDLRRFPFDQATADVAAVVEVQAAFWGQLPYDRYYFLNVLEPGGGGLEHRASTLLLFPPDEALTLEGWRRWLGLVSHELFHAWNGKRLRPRSLGPFDLEREAYTESLWVVEGITSYYDDLLLRRAGLLDDEGYLKTLSETAEKLAGTQGETLQSLARSSFDAWIELYRPDADSPASTVSYYVKGALVGFVLDAAIRERSRGSQSLDDVLRALYDRGSGEVGYADEDVYATLEELAGPELRAQAEALVRTASRLDLGPALATLGLRMAREPRPPADALQAAAEAGKQTFAGVDVRRSEGRWIVRSVVRDGPAWAAGVSPDDELVALGGDRVPDAGLEPLLRLHLPGDQVELLVARRGRMHALTLELGTRPRPPKIEVDPEASAAARRQRALWLLGASPRGDQATRRPPSTK